MKEAFIDGMTAEEWVKEKIRQSRESEAERKAFEEYAEEVDKRVAFALLGWCKKNSEKEEER